MAASSSTTAPRTGGPATGPTVCPPPDFMATAAVRNLDLAPAPPAPDDPTPRADLVWTFPGGIVELYRGGEGRYPVNPGRPTVVRGFDGQIGPIHEGFGVEWSEGSDPCERFVVNAFGMSEAELLRFANGLRRTDK